MSEDSHTGAYAFLFVFVIVMLLCFWIGYTSNVLLAQVAGTMVGFLMLGALLFVVLAILHSKTTKQK